MPRSMMGENRPGTYVGPTSLATAMPMENGATSVTTTSSTAASLAFSAACTAAPSATASSGGKLREGRRSNISRRQPDDTRHAGGPAHQQHLLDLRRPGAGVAQRPHDRRAQPGQQLGPRRLGLGLGERLVEIQRGGRRRAGRQQRRAPTPGRTACRLACSQAWRSRAHDTGPPPAPRAWPVRPATSFASASTKSSPPRRVSPADDWISITPSITSSTVTSKVPPPRSSTTARNSRSRWCRP